jgi:DnaK suppressor protein
MALDLGRIREQLEIKRAELQHEDSSLESEVHSNPVDPLQADQGPYDQGDEAVDLQQLEGNQAVLVNEDALLTQVKEALKQLDNGTYGKCMVCGKPIPEKRLQAIPWALLCVEDQEQLEVRNLSIQDFLFARSNMDNQQPLYSTEFSQDDELL